MINALKTVSRRLLALPRLTLSFAQNYGNYPCPECCTDCVYYYALSFIEDDWETTGTWEGPAITGRSGTAYITAAPTATYSSIEVSLPKPWDDPADPDTPRWNTDSDAFTLILNNGGTEHTATFHVGKKGITGDRIDMEGETKSATFLCDSNRGFNRACLSLDPSGTLKALLVTARGTTICVEKSVGMPDPGRPGIQVHQPTTFASVTYENLDIGGPCEPCKLCPDEYPQSFCCCAFKNTDPNVDPVPETVTVNISGYSKFDEVPDLEADLEDSCNCNVTIGGGCNECSSINGSYDLTFNTEDFYADIGSDCLLTDFGQNHSGCMWDGAFAPLCTSPDCTYFGPGIRRYISVNIYNTFLGCKIQGYIDGCAGATRGLPPIPDDEFERCDVDGTLSTFNERCQANCGLGDCSSCCYLTEYGNLSSNPVSICAQLPGIGLLLTGPLCEAGYATDPSCDPNDCLFPSHCCACCHTADMTVNFNTGA